MTASEQQGDFEIHACFTVEMFGGKRWVFTTCTLFVLCLRRPYIAASTQRLNSNQILTPKFNVRGKPFVPKWTLNIARDKGSSSRLEEAEPGFDFNAEEMKKLKIWPGGAIPYYIEEFSFDKVFRDRIRNFLDLTNMVTGVNFLELHRPPGDDETRWVFFVNRQGLLSCVDHPFKNFTSEGVQKVLIGYDCLSTDGNLADVVLALLGVPPQHNAPDRNKYIEIVKKNIMPEKGYLFEVLQDNEWLFHDIDYDFTSAGHYNLHKYTVNGKATIKPLKQIQSVDIGEGKGFSYIDIWKIRMIYNYITQKRLKSVSVPECNKLFNLGTNFSNAHESEEDVQPRKKPNKYLGLPDELIKSPLDNQETNNDTETNLNPDEEVEEVTKEENAEENSPEIKNDIEKKDNMSNKSNEILDHKNNSESQNESANTGKKLNDVTSNENQARPSDSETYAKPHLLKFTKPGHNG